MRISDWSSDVCSSDLRVTVRRFVNGDGKDDRYGPDRDLLDQGKFHGHPVIISRRLSAPARRDVKKYYRYILSADLDGACPAPHLETNNEADSVYRLFAARADVSRHPSSEEHTSELKSLMRLSYAVFCLQKK